MGPALVYRLFCHFVSATCPSTDRCIKSPGWDRCRICCCPLGHRNAPPTCRILLRLHLRWQSRLRLRGAGRGVPAIGVSHRPHLWATSDAGRNHDSSFQHGRAESISARWKQTQWHTNSFSFGDSHGVSPCHSFTLALACSRNRLSSSLHKTTPLADSCTPASYCWTLFHCFNVHCDLALLGVGSYASHANAY